MPPEVQAGSGVLVCLFAGGSRAFEWASGAMERSLLESHQRRACCPLPTPGVVLKAQGVGVLALSPS